MVVTLAVSLYSFRATNETLTLLAGAAIIPGFWIAERIIGVSDPRRQTISSFWFLTYLVMIFWPAFFVYVDEPGPHRNAFLGAVAVAVVAVPAGAGLVTRLLHSSRGERDAFFSRPLDELRPSKAMFLVCVAIAVAITASVLLYLSLVQDIPLLYMLRYPGCDLVLAQLREDAFKLLDPRWNAESGTLLFYLFLPLRTIVDPFILVAFFGFWFVSRERRWLILFLVILAVTSFYAASSLARAPVAALVLRMALLFYVLRAGHISWRAGAVWTAAVLIFPLIVTFAAYRPGPPPSDCGPAAYRGPEIGKAAVIDPYLVLTDVAAAPGTSASPASTPSATNPGTATQGRATARPIPTSPILVPTVPPTGPIITNPVVAATPSPSPTPQLSFGEQVLRGIDPALLVARRLSYTEAYALYTYFPVFPSQHDWLWGQTLVKPVLRFWGADFYVENYVYRVTFPTSPIPTGHLNAAFQSNFYADFGLPGVVVGGVVTGVIMRGLEIYLWRRRKTILELATFTVLVYAFWVLHSGSLTSVLITNGALPVLLIAPTMRLGERLLTRWGIRR